MRAALVDTDAASVLFNPVNSKYSAVAQAASGRFLLISFMTRAELLYWPLANFWGETRNSRLRANIGRYITLFPDDLACEYWASIRLESKRKGRPIATSDAWVAATAIRYRIPLNTLNHRDFNFLDDLELIPIQDPATNG